MAIYFCITGGVGACILFLVMRVPYRLRACCSFWNPWNDPEQKALPIQSMLSFHSGGFWGVGLGEAQGKFFLPEAHTDFTLAIFGEEMGFFGFLFCCHCMDFILPNDQVVIVNGNFI